VPLLFPTLYRRRITDVTVEDLHRLGARCLLLDVDNTLTTHDAPELDPAVMAWLDGMRGRFVMVVVSNNNADRVAPFAEKIRLPFHALARKPLPGGFWEAGAEHQMSKEECVVIGDQIFTDILGANLAGMHSILLEPIQMEVEQKFIAFKRKVERPLLNSRKQKARREQDYGER